MNTKNKFKSKLPQSSYSTEVSIQIKSTRRRVTKPMELRLVVRPGTKPGRYRFEQAETKPDGTVLLHLYGPLGRSFASMRYISPEQVVSVHRPTVAKAIKDEDSRD